MAFPGERMSVYTHTLYLNIILGQSLLAKYSQLFTCDGETNMDRKLHEHYSHLH